MKLVSALSLLVGAVSASTNLSAKKPLRLRTMFEEVNDGIADAAKVREESSSSFMSSFIPGEDAPFFERFLMSSMSMSVPHAPSRTPPARDDAGMCASSGCASPCTEANIAAGSFHHAHCDDPTKFLQCDEFGGCFVMPCVPGLVWSADATTCVLPEDFTDNAVGQVVEPRTSEGLADVGDSASDENGSASLGLDESSALVTTGAQQGATAGGVKTASSGRQCMALSHAAVAVLISSVSAAIVSSM